MAVDNNVLVSYIVSRIQADVEFLAQQHQLSHADATAILERLPLAGHVAPPSPPSTYTDSSVPSTPELTHSLKRTVPPPPQTRQQVRAIWDYQGAVSIPLPTAHQSLTLQLQDASDLSFVKGDIITLITETNEDWWHGRLKERSGL